ncbi:MAG: PhnD/SsuA/transferrin family substrate-binding protein [Thermodesulfobacteriota bacterium]
MSLPRTRLARACALLGLLGCLLASSSPAAGVPPASFYYFNPDSPQSNLGLLKATMDGFLAEAGFPLSFQPFAHLTDFVQQLAAEPPAFLLLPSWYLERHGQDLGVRPLLAPVRQGSTSYRKVLVVARGTGPGLDGLRHRTLAMTTFGPKGRELLSEILFPAPEEPKPAFNIVVVPKDVDALFALALQHVDAALVVPENMEALAKVNPRLVQRVETVRATKPIPLPVLCYRPGVVSPERLAQLTRLFLAEETRPVRMPIMEMLGIDGWQEIPH